MSDEWMSPQDIADEFGVAVATIYDWNYRGHGPPVYKFGQACRYRRSEVLEWAREH